MGPADSDATATAAAASLAETPVKLHAADYARYQVLSELARGGNGRILRAHDRKLDRPVALKVPLAPEGVTQFAREAWITARLQHPAIVPVYEAGLTPEGSPFYAMKLVSGTSLREVIAARKTLAERLALLPSVIAVADAVAYAHGRRIIHRDLKPSNVLVGDYGETVVLDWGVAKQLGTPNENAAASAGSAEATATSALQGTPAYMAPEQARLEAVDERSDVYALGALLYHVLTGQPPYAGGDASEVLARLALGPPPDVAVLAAGTPADLAAVVKKAMARDPGDRYPTAKELADELRRFQSGQMLSAHRYSSWQLLRRFVARYRAAVAVAALMTTVLVVVGLASVSRIARERSAAETRRDQLLLLQAHDTLSRDPTAALAWLKQYPLAGADWPTARDYAARALSSGTALDVRLGARWVDGVRGGRRLVFRTGDRTLRVWDVPDDRRHTVELPAVPEQLALSPRGDEVAMMTGEKRLYRIPLDGGAPRLIWQGQEGLVAGLQWSPDNTWLVADIGNGDLWIWDLATGDRRVVHAHPTAGNVKFSSDGKWLVSAAGDKTVGIWNARGEGRHLVGHEAEVRSACLSPDGKSVASGSFNRTVRLWDLATGKSRVLGRQDGGVFIVDFSPDGKWVASSSGSDGLVQLWPVDGGPPKILRGHTAAVNYFEFSPDGRWLATGSDDTTVRLWDRQTGAVQVLRGHAATVIGFYFLDGWLASWSQDGGIRTWRLSPSPYRMLAESTTQAPHFAFSPDGHRLAMGTPDLRVCDWPSLTCRELPGQDALFTSIVFSQDGAQVATASMDGTVRVWPSAGGAATILRGHAGRIFTLAFSPDGREVVATADRTVRLWDLASAAGRVIDTHDHAAIACCFTPDGNRVASAGEDGALHVWERQSGKTHAFPGHKEVVLHIACAPDGKHVLSGSFDNDVRWWDLDSGETRVIGRHDGAVQSVALSRDGRLAASGGMDKQVKVWDLAGGSAHTFTGHDATVVHVAFSPDGTRLASVAEEPALRVWDLVGGEHLVIESHEKGIPRVSFSPDGRFVTTASLDHTVRAFDLGQIRPLPRDPAALHELIARASFATIEPGQPVANPLDR